MVRQLPGGESVAAKYEGMRQARWLTGGYFPPRNTARKSLSPTLTFSTKYRASSRQLTMRTLTSAAWNTMKRQGHDCPVCDVKEVGCRYVWGTSGPNTFDCSGLVNWCAKMCGLTVPWAKVPGVSATNTRRSAANAQGYINAGKAIPESEMKQGDIIFFRKRRTSNTVKTSHMWESMWGTENSWMHATRKKASSCLNTALTGRNAQQSSQGHIKLHKGRKR